MSDDDLLIFEQAAAFKRDNDRRIAEQMEKLAADRALLHRAAEMLKRLRAHLRDNSLNDVERLEDAADALIRELESRLAL